MEGTKKRQNGKMKEKQEVKSLWARKKTSQQNEYVQGKTSDLEKGQHV